LGAVADFDRHMRIFRVFVNLSGDLEGDELSERAEECVDSATNRHRPTATACRAGDGVEAV
jgi:hypothetical protein